MSGSDGLALAVDADLLEDVTHGRADRLSADREHLCDAFLRQTLGDEPQHFGLAWAQRMLRLFAHCKCDDCRLQATRERADACDQLAGVKWLAHIIVAPKLEAGDLVVALGADPGNEDDADAAPVALAQAPAYVIPRHLWHLQVEQDNPRLFIPRSCERRLTTCHGATRVTRLGEQRLGQRSKRRVVIDDQNAAIASQGSLRSLFCAIQERAHFGSAPRTSQAWSLYQTPNVGRFFPVWSFSFVSSLRMAARPSPETVHNTPSANQPRDR